MRILLLCMLFAAFAHADRTKPPSVVARVVGIEITSGAVLVTVATGSDQGITKHTRARFRDGATTKLLADGEAVLIRVDRRTCVLKTKLSPERVRSNHFVQFDL